MDERRAVGRIEIFDSEWWPSLEVGKILCKHAENNTYIMTAFRIGTMRIILELAVGKRGGLTEEVHIIDDAKKGTARLIVSKKYGTMESGALVDLWALRARKKEEHLERVDIVKACADALVDFIKMDQKEVLSRIYLATLDDDDDLPITTVSGGLSSLGKRR